MSTELQLIREILELCRQMIILADKGHESVQDDGCRLLLSVLQDCAYKIRHEAERELHAHQGTAGRTG